MISFVANTLRKKLPVSRFRGIKGKVKAPLRRWLVSIATEKLGLHIVSRQEIYNYSKVSGNRVLKFGSEEIIEAVEPYNYSGEIPKLIANKIGTFTLSEPFIAEVSFGELIGPTSVGFSGGRNLFLETVAPTSIGRAYRALPARTLITKLLPHLGSPQVDTAFSLVNYFSRNYYHWIIDCLTRLEGIEYYREQTGRKPTLIINSSPSIWQVESLRLLGYELDDCIEWNGPRMKVKRLLVPSFRREGNITSPMACSWFRSRILSNLPNIENKKLSFSSKIFISRPKTAGRHVVNEDEVMNTLSPLGFVAYTLEDMSFSDQVRLFSQAEIVVAVHGAALTNIIFSQDLVVIELFGSMADQMYFLLANGLGFSYACLTSDLDADKYRKKFDGITVNVTKLKALVEETLYISSNRCKSNKRVLNASSYP